MHENMQKGAITLEACVSVLLFLIMMLFLSSFFVMFMTQNITGHVALQTAQSLALEAYSEKLVAKDDKDTAFKINDGVHLFVKRLFGSAEESPNFVMDTYWTNDTQDEIAKIVESRFLGYLQGGDETKADALLKSLNIPQGTEGLDFSESHIVNDTLYVVVKYQLEYDFNLWGVRPVEVEQSACAKLWKNG